MQILPADPAPRPRTGVSILVLRKGEALLVRRAKEPYAGCWSLPGGTQEFGETMEAAARRELAEETGLVGGDLSFAEIVEPMVRSEGGSVLRHFVLALFICRAFEGEPAAGDDAYAAAWFAFDAMEGLEMTPGTAALIRRIAG